ncbi:PKD domain-containing protein, partial [Candidatus Bipolaricaulota bacterium]|nr:PKD domain-containing protein [Candidatus Bipolaricaulota bacterium]
FTHAFAEDGAMFIQARITDDRGETAVSEVLLLTVVSQPPVARFSADFDDNTEGSLVQFVDSSVDDDGMIASWAWDFGDGVTSNDSNPSHIYNSGGTFIITLSVIDDDGMQSAPTMFEIEIRNSAPQAEFNLQQSTASAGSPLTFIDESFDSSSNGNIIHVAWDFGDGSYQAGGPSSTSEYSHTFAVAGTYIVTLYVIDNDGELGLVQLPITIL